MLCVLVVLLALSVAPVRAAVTHNYLSQITEVPAEGPLHEPVASSGALGDVRAMTVDSGQLYVADAHSGMNFRLNKFNVVSGAFVSQFPAVPSLSYLYQGVAVDHLTGEVYVGGDELGTKQGVVAVFDAAGALQEVWKGTPSEAFGCFDCSGAGDVAVDNSTSLGDWAAGDVYVSDPEKRVVDVFKPEAGGKGKYVARLEGTCAAPGTCTGGEVIPFNGLTGVVVDPSNGDVLVGENRAVDVFEPTVLGQYAFVRQLTGTPAGVFGGVLGGLLGVTVDGGNGDIYVVEQVENAIVIDQFSSAGVFLGRLTGTPSGPFTRVESVAVDPESHSVYVGGSGVVDVFGPDLVIPDVTTGPATSVMPYGGTLTGTVNLDKEGEATCQFLWGTSKEFGQVMPCSKAVTEEESGVQATLGQAAGSKLEPDTTYYYRLQATNRNGLNPGDPSQDREFRTTGPGIHGEAVSNVAATSVTFNATIDPNHAPTTYYFQYGLTSGYGANLPAAPGLSLGAGEGDVETIPQHYQGLEVGTVYHYRVVVVSELSPGRFEVFDGPDQTFTTQSSNAGAGLVDGRSWEMVTPPQKQGTLFFPIRFGIIQASARGDAIVDLASMPTEVEPHGYSPAGVSVLSTRGSAGWSSQDLSPPRNIGSGFLTGEGVEYRLFSEDLSLGIVHPFRRFAPLSPEASGPTPYLRTDYLTGDPSDHCQGSCFKPLVTAANTPSGTVFDNCGEGEDQIFCGPTFVDATPDLSHIIIESRVPLTSEPATYPFQYEWTEGKLKSTDSVRLGSRSLRHAISDDGSRVVGFGESEGLKGLLMRDLVKGVTVRLDLPQGGPGTGFKQPEFLTASSDGSKVFFLDEERLTAESSAGGTDLYEYDLNAPLGRRLTDLSVDRHAGEGANVEQVLGASEDGSYVYFAAAGRLTPEAKNGICSINPSPGDLATCNLYVAHAGTTRLVAELSAGDYPDWNSQSLGQLTARVSPNGRWLAFTSNRNLTGYDTRDAVSGRPDEEVYLYNASSSKLVCASCNPSGARPVGVEYNALNLAGAGGLWGDNPGIAANVPPWTITSLAQAFYQSRYLSDSGRLFFDSNDALVSQDVNGTEDVYQYEPPGVGDCASGSASFSERSGGCVGLISSGTSAEESVFLDASTTGGDVFFLTAAKLVSQDFDTALDVYDAHECTVQVSCFAVPSVLPPVCSTGDSCKAAPSPQPLLFGSPSSATFSGAGNVSSSGPAPVLKSKELTRGQKLARALRACSRKHNPKQRAVCQREVKKRYGARSGKANAAKKGRG